MELRAQLDRLLSQEEAKWKQTTKIDELVDGDCNTKYFHAKANGRHTRNKITVLDRDKGRIEGDEKLIDYITNFYKGLFGHPEVSHISLCVDNSTTMLPAHKEALVAEFSMEEIKKAVFQMAHKKSPCPDGFIAEFCDFKQMFDDFYNGVLDTKRLNYGIITLLPKKIR